MKVFLARMFCLLIFVLILCLMFKVSYDEPVIDTVMVTATPLVTKQPIKVIKAPSTTTPEPTAKPTVKPTKKPKPTATPLRYYDVPLTKDVQDYIFLQCEKYEIEPSLVIAIIEQESDYNPVLVSDTGDHGLMQINVCNHNELRQLYGDIDFMDAKDNIKCGVAMIAGLIKEYGEHKGLMAYNMGVGGAGKCWRKGIETSCYSRSVIERKERLEREQKQK